MCLSARANLQTLFTASLLQTSVYIDLTRDPAKLMTRLYEVAKDVCDEWNRRYSDKRNVNFRQSVEANLTFMKTKVLNWPQDDAENKVQVRRELAAT